MSDNSTRSDTAQTIMLSGKTMVLDPDLIPMGYVLGVFEEDWCDPCGNRITTGVIVPPAPPCILSTHVCFSCAETRRGILIPLPQTPAPTTEELFPDPAPYGHTPSGNIRTAPLQASIPKRTASRPLCSGCRGPMRTDRRIAAEVNGLRYFHMTCIPRGVKTTTVMPGISPPYLYDDLACARCGVGTVDPGLIDCCGTGEDDDQYIIPADVLILRGDRTLAYHPLCALALWHEDHSLVLSEIIAGRHYFEDADSHEGSPSP